MVTLVVFEVGSTEVVVVILTLPSLIVVVALASEEVDLTVVVFEVLLDQKHALTLGQKFKPFVEMDTSSPLHAVVDQLLLCRKFNFNNDLNLLW